MSLVGFGRVIRGRLFPPANPTGSLEGKTVLLTGGTSGLGLEAAIKYINLGVSSLIIGCRNAERGNDAKRIIEERTKHDTNTDSKIQIWPLDMASYQSVKTFVERVNDEIPRLDIALLNAGGMHRKYTLTQDGWEETLQVNALSTALLGLLLLPKLRASRDPVTGMPAHLTLISSGSYRHAKAEEIQPEGASSILQHLNSEEAFRAHSQYRASKVLVEYTAKSLANLTRCDDGKVEVIVNSACPGYCRSGLGREYDALHERMFVTVFELLFGRTSEQGSRTLVSATMLGEESHGKWWRSDEYPDISATLTGSREGKILQIRAWEEIVGELKLRSPEVQRLT
ncbi:WW domain-containing oxidoreductase [Arthroderma uncinatum]|uniref:WW domain-containing oxidoreductase n=1 Tax=Arthroderma uncinatum TaxID=74035 RepID=UPI00144AE5A5|nr:WW domain-containing oxidoreductase [Arthroderma uncinatum]KAF3481259.1 WW domain-containing oxidoreductase [Arthroderma uncinatum]